MNINWTNRKKILDKRELNHLHNDAGCKTKAQFQNTLKIQHEWRLENPDNPEPCWDCLWIAGKLNMLPGVK